MPKGVVKRVIPNKNYAFAERNGVDYFFHREDFHGHWEDLERDVWNKLEDGITVAFDIIDSPKGPRAGHVRRVSHPNEGNA